MARRARRRFTPDLRRSGGYVALGAMACLAFVYAASAPLLPWPSLVVLAVVWLALTGTAIRWFGPRPARAVWLPVAGLAAWIALVLLEAARR